MIGLQKESKTI